jgi:hypothetical protein
MIDISSGRIALLSAYLPLSGPSLGFWQDGTGRGSKTRKYTSRWHLHEDAYLSRFGEVLHLYFFSS